MRTEPIKQLLSAPVFSFLAILFSCYGRIAHYLQGFRLGTDKSYQLQAAKNFYEGKGISTHEVFLADLSQAVYTPLIKWPAGYSILNAPLVSMSGERYACGSVLIDLLTCIAFVLLSRALFKQLASPVWITNLFTLLTGFFFYHFGMSISTDLLSLVFFQAGVLCVIALLREPSKIALLVIFSIFLLWTSSFIRYLSIPLAFTVPLYMIYHGWLQDKVRIRKQGIMIFVGIALLVGTQLLLQKMIGGSATYLYPLEKGFFPGNLLRTGPFLFETVGNLEPPVLALEKTTGIRLAELQQPLVIIHLILLAGLFVYFLIRLVKNKGRAENMTDHFFNLAVLVTVTTFLMLAFLSVTNSLHRPEEFGWTYVSELRYYAIPIFFLQLYIFSRVFHYKKSASRIKKILLLILLIIMSASTLHGIYFVLKKTVTGQLDITRNKQLVELDKGRAIVHEIVAANRDKQFVCVSNEYTFTNLVSIWENMPGLHNVYAIDFKQLSSSGPVSLIVAIRKEYGMKLLTDLQMQDQQPYAETERWIFYLKHL